MTISVKPADTLVRPFPASVDGVRYSGRIMPTVDVGIVLQRTGRSILSLVAHDISNLSRVPVEGEVVDIKYQGGKGNVSERKLGLGVER